MKKWACIRQDFAGRFKNRYLREASRRSSVILVYLGVIHAIHATQKIAGYPIGGALSFVDSIERRFRGLEGKFTSILA